MGPPYHGADPTQAPTFVGHKNLPNSVKPTFLPAKLVRTPTHQYKSTLLENRLYTNDHPKSLLCVIRGHHRTDRHFFDDPQRAQKRMKAARQRTGVVPTKAPIAKRAAGM